jgi:hypothetical protein
MNPPPKKNRKPFDTFMTRHLLIITLALFLVYGFVEAFPLIIGPSLSVHSPLDSASIADGVVEIRGTTARIASLTLNDAPLLRDKEGAFSSTLTFPQGSSILTFIAADRFGRTTVATRTIFVPFTHRTESYGI